VAPVLLSALMLGELLLDAMQPDHRQIKNSTSAPPL
jgi:hypothetical protein